MLIVFNYYLLKIFKTKKITETIYTKLLQPQDRYKKKKLLTENTNYFP